MRTFNYTGRKKVLRQDVTIIALAGNTLPPTIDVSADLSDYSFPETAQAFIEAHHQTRFMRLPLGKVANTLHKNNLKLTDFQNIDDIKFGLKIVDQSAGQLLGLASNIKISTGDDLLDKKQKEILPVRSTDLSEVGVLWRVVFENEESILEIEKRLGNKEQVVRSLLFKGFIHPAAMREILSKILIEGWDNELSDPDDLSTRWLLFTQQLGADISDINNDDPDEWLQETVRLLTNKIGVRQQILNDLDLGGWL